jgi:hypothetical protein
VTVIGKQEVSFYANLVDLMKDPVMKAEANKALQVRDKDVVEKLLKEDAA